MYRSNISMYVSIMDIIDVSIIRCIYLMDIIDVSIIRCMYL